MAKVTTDHETIRKWVEARGGCPSRVKSSGKGGDPGILRIDFPGFSGKSSLESIGWDEFFTWFDENGLAFIYQDRARGGQPSRFSKLVARETVAARERGAGRPARQPSRRERGGREGARERAGESSQLDAILLLAEQHREFDELLEELSGQSPRSAEFRQTFEELADLLAIHSEIEEKIFYPSVKSADTEELLEESVEEHLAVKRVLATMMETAPDGDVFAELEELAGLMEEHVFEEEYQLFPKVSQQMDPAELRQLGGRMNEMVEQLRREGAPRMHVREELEAPAPI